MRKLNVFNSVTLDGYFTGEGGDLGWAHAQRAQDEEWNDYVAGNAGGGGTLVFGRITYEMMKAFWPTAEAREQMPEVAEGMNRMEKVVFSRSLNASDWSNTRILNGDLAGEVRKLKEAPDEGGLTILGSGSIVAQLAPTGLIDEYQLVVVPVALGKGRTMFERISSPVELELTETRSFRNGNVVLCYASRR